MSELKIPQFQLRTKVNFAEIYKVLRSEYGTPMTAMENAADLIADADEDVAAIDQEIEDYKAQIRRLQSRVISLQNERQHLANYRTCLRGLKSPLQKLANELLLLIFEYACDMNEITSKQLRTMPTLVISNVCWRWRNLARSFPALWSRIDISLGRTPPRLSGLPVLDLFLQSSRKSPLTIQISSTQAILRYHLDVWVTLFAQSSRWRKIALSRFSTFPPLLLSNDEDKNYPMLEELDTPKLAFDDLEYLDHFQSSPKLHRFSVSCVPLHDLDNHQFPWHQITYLDCAQYSEEIKSVFKKCLGLQELRFRQITRNAIQAVSSPVTAPSVEKLSLLLPSPYYREPERLEHVIFTSLTCPALNTLSMEGASYANVWPTVAFNSFITRSAFHLTTLSIKFIPLSDYDLIGILHQLSSLIHLTIADCTSVTTRPVTSQLVESLNASRRTISVMVKNLQSLSLASSGSGMDKDFDQNFVDMVCSRWFPDVDGKRYGMDVSNTLGTEAGPACLRSVVLHFTHRQVDENIFAQLRPLEEDGLKVIVLGQ